MAPGINIAGKILENLIKLTNFDTNEISNYKSRSGSFWKILLIFIKMIKFYIFI